AFRPRNRSAAWSFDFGASRLRSGRTDIRALQTGLRGQRFDHRRDLRFAAQRAADLFEAISERRRIRRAYRRVADLAARARRLAVVVPMRAGNREQLVAIGQFTNPVEHARWEVR